MNKDSYINTLYQDLKDKIEFDEDVEALFRILTNMMEINRKKGIEYWLYIMNHYYLDLQKDIDFTPLAKNFLLEILNYFTLQQTLHILTQVSHQNQPIINQHFFNVFHQDSIIYQYFYQIIIKKQSKKELEELSFLAHQKLNKLIFDTTIFLKNIILIHIRTKQIDVALFLKISDLPKKSKDKALLKSLFIEYI